MCKKCQKFGRKHQNKQEANQSQEWDIFFESDENFVFIADYTEGGAPFGITHEEWDEIEQQENNRHGNQVFITISDEIADRLRNLDCENSLEKSVYLSIAVSLLVANSISIHKASAIAGYNMDDFLRFLQSNQIPWSFGEEDGHKEYQKSIADLLKTIDTLSEQREDDE